LRSRAERPLLILGALYLAAVLHGLGAADIVGDDEAREAGIVQDVVAGHWLLPRFNATTLPDKPILYHWLAAVPCAVAGFSEAAVRLPSALAGAALIVWTGAWGAELLGTSAGLAGAALLATTLGLFDHARVARPDVLLVLLLMVALGLAFRWWRDGRRGDATRALAVLGAATFAKGPVAPVLFLLTLSGFLAWQGDLRRIGRFFTLPGVAAFVVLGLGWYAVALAGWDGLFVREHLVGRYVRNLAGGLASGGPYSRKPLLWHLTFYPEHLLAITLPWTPVIVLALWQAWRTGGFHDPRLRFLVCASLAPVVAFTPAEWKLRYYLLPSLPPLALIAAPALVRLVAMPPRRIGARSGVVTAAVGLVLAGVTTALFRARGMSLSPSDRTTLEAVLTMIPGGATGIVAGAGFVAGALAVAIVWRAWAALLGITAVGIACWMALGVPALEQVISRRDSLKTFAHDVVEARPPPAAIDFYGEAIRPVVVYVGRPIATLSRMENPAEGAVVIATEEGARALARRGILALPLVVGEGRIGNLERGRIVLLEIAPN
jgi:4-amino-4-deoxy-L-arabinose transferase-like glycosyltransferase